MKRLVSPLLLVLFCIFFSTGWRTSPSDFLVNPVSMTLDANRLFVSDPATGLHVYDVTSLSAPSEVIRIPLDGNVSSAVKGDIVYANKYQQLQAIRITGDSYTVVAKIGEEYNYIPWNEGPMTDDSGFGCACANSYDAAPRPASAPTGGGSSYATFAVIDDDLYRVNYSDLIVYDVANNEKPKEVSRVHVGWDIETLFPTQTFLFIGGRAGMYIFDREDPRHPQQLSHIEHARACDPVVVDGPIAYVTLRTSNGCGAAPADELLCVNIKDPLHPRIIGEKPLATPWGLAAREGRLYVGQGESGYSLLDVSQPSAPEVKATWVGSTTHDFIWSGNTLFLLEDHNVSIYDVTDPLAPKFLAKVEPESS